MDHRTDTGDRELVRAFEACAVAPEDFDHAAHVRLAYAYLCREPLEEAVQRMKRSLLAFLDHVGADRNKYHETMTRAWFLAVDHFMRRSPPCSSSRVFLAVSPELLDAAIMGTHYSAEVLSSPSARSAFVEPDLQAIPASG